MYKKFNSYERNSPRLIPLLREPTPSFLDGKTQYTHSEMLTILATDEWTPGDPE